MLQQKMSREVAQGQNRNNMRPHSRRTGDAPSCDFNGCQNRLPLCQLVPRISGKSPSAMAIIICLSDLPINAQQLHPVESTPIYFSERRRFQMHNWAICGETDCARTGENSRDIAHGGISFLTIKARLKTILSFLFYRFYLTARLISARCLPKLSVSTWSHWSRIYMAVAYFL